LSPPGRCAVTDRGIMYWLLAIATIAIAVVLVLT
jgi:hypothetical protein